ELGDRGNRMDDIVVPACTRCGSRQFPVAVGVPHLLVAEERFRLLVFREGVELTRNGAAAWAAARAVADQEILVLDPLGHSAEFGDDFTLAVPAGVCAVIEDRKD